MLDTVFLLLTESWQVLGQMSPYLIFGFAMAGLLSVALSPDWLERHLGGGGMGPVWKASLFGVPLPLCSCSVIPVSVSLRQHGASRAATSAFLLSTPQTGVDSIMVTYAMLGPLFAIYRPVAAFLTGILGGGLVRLFQQGGVGPEPDRASAACSDGCCATDRQPRRWRRFLQHGFVTLPRDIAGPLLVGILIAGIMAALVPQGRLEAYLGGGILSILLLMLAGVPVYVCATASVPIAAGFMHMGASPGAALAFLIAGPATNAATFTTLWKALGRRSAVLYLITVAVSALSCGLLLDWLTPRAAEVMPRLASVVHEHESTSWTSHVWAIALLGVLAFSSWWRPGSAGGESVGESEADGEAAIGNELQLRVVGMTCDHCARSVRRAIVGCAGVASATVERENGRVTVVGTELDPSRLIHAVTEAGFTAELPPGSG